jgi:hypothetical protein
MRLYTQQKSACGHPVVGAFLCNQGSTGIKEQTSFCYLAMYAPRRHSRRLLLPPGWVALGFLLLLGCQALLAHRQQLRLPNVIQLQLPPWKSKGDSWGVPVYGPMSKINSFRPWHDAALTGAPLNDFINATSAEVAVKAINADTNRAGGVRIRFGQHTTYSNLVSVLDMMNYLNHKRYWLDIRHNPVTLYAITNQYVPVKTNGFSLLGGCLLYDDVYIPTPPVSTWEQILIRDISSLWQKAWRLPTLLFIVLITLSIYRLARPRPSLR